VTPLPTAASVIDIFWPIAEAAEGIRFMPYDDSTGKPIPMPEGSKGNMTIGCGTKLPLDAFECYLLFAHRAQKIVDTMSGTWWWQQMDSMPNRQAALLEIAYNTGSIFKWPELIRECGLKDWQGAHDAVLNSKAANDPRLHARYERIANTMLTGNL